MDFPRPIFGLLFSPLHTHTRKEHFLPYFVIIISFMCDSLVWRPPGARPSLLYAWRSRYRTFQSITTRVLPFSPRVLRSFVHTRFVRLLYTPFWRAITTVHHWQKGGSTVEYMGFV